MMIYKKKKKKAKEVFYINNSKVFKLAFLDEKISYVYYMTVHTHLLGSVEGLTSTRST